VTNFVDSHLFLARQISTVIGGIFFEEVADFVARRKEVVVTNVITIIRGEFGLTDIGEAVLLRRGV
jgi:hypothetical protein